MLLTGAQILIECLKEQGVDTVFGFPGGAVLNIYDELYKHQSEVRHYLTSHEQGAAHAADGYARSTGKVGVCIATSGPGATNLVTGIATAYMDSIPLVAITGNVAVPLLGKDSFQEVDIAGITMPITKHNYIVKDVNELADVIREAFYIAQEGRKGPVLIDIPKDVTAHKAEYEYQKPREIFRHTDSINETNIEEAIRLIAASKKPFVFVGGGLISSKAEVELLEFVEKLQSPVTCSLMSMGGFSGDHPLYTGMLGMHGTKASNLGVTNCDLLVVIGARFSDRVTGNTVKFANNAQILHIDIDPAEVNKNVLIHHYIIGDVREVLTRLNAKLTQQNHDEWIQEIEDLKLNFPLKYNSGLTGQYAIEKLCEITEGNAIISTEVGQHQMWTAQHYLFKKPNLFLTSGGLGTMGFGLGASIGAKIANPDKTVVNIAGDGSFRMNLNEILTAVRYSVPIVVLIINNNVLGMVRQWQSFFYEERYSFTNLSPDLDYVKLAEAFGAVGINLTEKDKVEETLRAAIAMKRPVIINCVVDKDDKVLPMVAPGAPINELILD